MKLSIIAVALLVSDSIQYAHCFSTTTVAVPASSYAAAPVARKTVLHAAVSADDIDLVQSDDDGFLNYIGSFLVDSFWLNSEHHNADYNGEQNSISEEFRTSLIIEQASDLQDKYGEVMGTRTLESCVIAALDKNKQEVVGCVTLKACLLQKNEKTGLSTVLEGMESEDILKTAVATLGPKQRKQFKGASASMVVKELLPNNEAICVLSNLAVSKEERGRGIAQLLCDEADNLVKNTWNYKYMHLVVEEENTIARALYENKLGYQLKSKNEFETALRIDFSDPNEGSFSDIECTTLLLYKEI